MRLATASLTTAVAALLSLLALAIPALAARPATADELQLMASDAGLAVACVTAEVSTVDDRWARLDTQQLEGCAGGDGFFVYKRDAYGDWLEQYQASEVFACPAAKVPVPVGRDLGVCRAPKSYLLCQHSKGGYRRIPKVKPRTCSTLDPADPLCCAANLEHLRWRHWGEPTATAHGVERGFHLPPARIKVRVKVYRRRVADCGDYVYTRLRAKSRYGTLVQKLPAVCGD